MATARVNGVELFYEASGTGEIPLVLIHGSWESHHDWDAIVPELAKSFRVFTYDRRGHSDSERPVGQDSVTEDVADLAGLIEHLDLSPAWVVGNSFGASIGLRLAGERPDLLSGAIAHEPPLPSLIAGDPDLAPALEELNQTLGAIVERIASGDHAGAAEQFVETVALGPGGWAKLPPASQQTLITNAPTFLHESRDPQAMAFKLAWLEEFDRPCLLTRGGESPPFFAPITDLLAGALPNAKIITFPEAGHMPHVTHPDVYAETVTTFIQDNAS